MMFLQLAYHLAKLQSHLLLPLHLLLRAASGAQGISKSTRKCFARNITNIRWGGAGREREREWGQLGQVLEALVLWEQLGWKWHTMKLHLCLQCKYFTVMNMVSTCRFPPADPASPIPPLSPVLYCSMCPPCLIYFSNKRSRRRRPVSMGCKLWIEVSM